MASLGKKLDTFSEVQIVPTIGDDAATFIFQNFEIGLRPFQKVVTKTLSLDLSLEENAAGLSLKQDIRGSFSLDTGITATLFIQSNGKSHQFNFTQESCSDTTTESIAVDIQESIAVEIQPSHSYLATLILVIENSTPDKKLEGSITIDSLDIELTNSEKS